MNNMNYEINEENTDKLSINKQNEIDSIINNNNFFTDIDDNDFQSQYSFFDQDNIMAQHIDYFENYNMKMLSHIAKYYSISIKKSKKEELIQTIIQFENDPENSSIVYERKRMWHYINELKSDHYFSKFVFFNS